MKGHVTLKHRKVVLGPRVRLSVYMNKSSAKTLSCAVCRKIFRRKLRGMQHMYVAHRSRRKVPRLSSSSSKPVSRASFSCQHFPEKFKYELEEMWRLEEWGRREEPEREPGLELELDRQSGPDGGLGRDRQ